MSTTEKRSYNFSDAELYQNNLLLANLMERDMNEFSRFGIDLTVVDNHRQKAEEFRNLQFDIEMLDAQKQSTADTNKLLNAVVEKFEEFQMKSDMAYRDGLVTFRLMDFPISEESNLQLTITTKSYANVIARRKDALIGKYGLTDTDFTEFENMTALLIDRLVNQKVAVIERKISTQERVRAGNKLYAEFVKYCELGKRIFDGKDPVKHSNYVIYPMSNVTEPDEGGGGEPLEGYEPLEGLS